LRGAGFVVFWIGALPAQWSFHGSELERPAWMGVAPMKSTVPMVDGVQGRRSGARVWFLVHGWAALPLWMFMFFVCLTGSIATVSQEIVWLADPAVRARAPAHDAQVLGYDEILAAVNGAQPDAVVQSISRPVK